MAELEPGAEVETLGLKAYTMQVVYSRQVGKACLAQTLARDAGQRRWLQGASGILGNGTSFLPYSGTYYSGKHVGLSEFRPGL